MLATIAVLGLWSGLGEHWVMAQSHPAASELVQKLQSDKTTDDARKQLLQLGKSDPDIRRYLVASLPPMIEMGPKSCPPSEIVDVFARWHTCPWYNVVELAGELKIGEAAPALAPWIGWRTPAPFILSLEARLVFYPAAKALAEIGDPAIPVVQPALDRGNSDEHYKAVRVLCIIHTPNAKAVLRDDLQRETDPDLQAMIRNALRK
ncbi:MAG TPA: HEAT repeat domain-containing protein [Candidatus Acidoferrum sp.]|jgi:hypothetical protein|nr:HEAT repeat domain-containing protein [Candidatus Acidoferrum sp.]